MKTKIFFPLAVLIFFIAAAAVNAQTPPLLEKQQMERPGFDQLKSNLKLQPAPPAGPLPPGPVHCCAEWEESEGIMTQWMNVDLMNKLQQDHQVYIPVNDQADMNGWISFLTNNGIPLTNFHFLFIQTSYIHTRDYGPWFIWDGNNEMGIVNYTCGYSFWDDIFPRHFAQIYNIKYYESGLNHVGGNYYPNAYGMAFSSTHLYELNGGTPKPLVDIPMERYYGINNYPIVAPKAIGHHDTWGKPSDPETLIIVDFPEKDPRNHAMAEGMAALYSTLESPWGRPYEIHRLPMFEAGPALEYRPYMNSLVSNRHVYVPIHQCADDRTALDVFRAAFEGYEVVGVNAKDCSWHDALHCRTRNFVKRQVIRIYPYPPGDTEETGTGYTVRAEVIPPRGADLLSGHPLIHWTDTGGPPYANVVMTPAGKRYEYTAQIPAQPLGTDISFYIEAQDNGGLSAIYPLVAPEGMMAFKVRSDREAPDLSRHIPLRSAAAGQWPSEVSILAKDDMAAPEVWVEYSINGTPQPEITLQREPLCYWYSGALAGSVAPGDVVSYRLHATDNAVSPNSTVHPPVGRFYCPVAEPGSVAVVNLSGRPVTAPFLLDAMGDLDVPCHYYETWPTDFSEHALFFICLGINVDNYVLSCSEANDIVAALGAGKHVYLEGGNMWCDDPEKAVLSPWFHVSGGVTWKGMSHLKGAAGTIMDGLEFHYVGEDLHLDEIRAVPPAQDLFFSQTSFCRTVIHDGGSYRTVASSFDLGGLLDKDWPNTGKEVLVRYLEFFGVDSIRLFTLSEAGHGETVPVRIKGDPGQKVLLAASLAEHYLPMAFGLFRLDPDYLFTLPQGLIPPSGVAEFMVQIPHNNDLVGLEIHFQALVGDDLVPGKAELTNRDIVKVTE